MRRLDFSLYKSLIETDFLLLNTNIKSSKNKKIELIKNVVFVDVLNSILQIKQFINLVKLIKSRKGLIQLLFSNTQEMFFFQDLKHSSKFKINFKKDLRDISKTLSTPKLNINFGYNLNQKVINNLFQKLFFLIQTFDLRSDMINCGYYKIFTDLTDYKKLVFITILLKKV
jgi:hypothetical protein